jgi:hypothetical protein
VNIPPRGPISPLGARGEVKNGPVCSSFAQQVCMKRMIIFFSQRVNVLRVLAVVSFRGTKL